MENIVLEKQIKEFIKIEYGDSSGFGNDFGNGYGSGNGSGSGDGYGYGYGYGYDYGSGNDYGSGYGDGYGSGNGSGSGDGYGYGDGSSSGYDYGYDYGSGNDYGSGYGDGDGSGDGYVTKIIKNNRIYYDIDGVKTSIIAIKNNVAKGEILNIQDFSTENCYIAKVGNYFAHAKDKETAILEATKKYNNNLPIEKRINIFVEKYRYDKKYLISELSEAHSMLTGSCSLGRKQFIKEKELDVNKKVSIKTFIELTENYYRGDIIELLEKKYLN